MANAQKHRSFPSRRQALGLSGEDAGTPVQQEPGGGLQRRLEERMRKKAEKDRALQKKIAQDDMEERERQTLKQVTNELCLFFLVLS